MLAWQMLGVICQAFFPKVPSKRGILNHKNQPKKIIYKFHYHVQENKMRLH